MTEIELVKKLRDDTGVGIMDCKKALKEASGDLELAKTLLRKKGLSLALQKTDRKTKEGVTAIYIKGNKRAGTVIELNSETDFVARNEKFQKLAQDIVENSASCNNIQDCKNFQLPSGKIIQEEIDNNIAVMGENISLRRIEQVKVDNGIVSSYVHNTVAPNIGKIAVLVALQSDINQEKLSILGANIAMHIAASKPIALNTSEVPTDLIEKEKNIFIEQARSTGKPESVINKMVDGRIHKFLEEIVLLEQVFIIDGKTKISEVVNNYAKELGSPIKITKFVRFEVGEDIEET